MTRKTKREISLLAVLLILLSFSIFSQFSEDSQVSVNTSLRRSSVPANTVSNEVLSFDLLSNQAPEFTEVKRNIFQFGSASKSAAQPQQFVPVSPPQVVVAPPSAIPTVQYLGFYYEKDTGLKMASLSNSGRVYVGKTGQILGGGKYMVQEIAADYVILKLLLQEGKFLRVPLGKMPASFVEWNEGSVP